MKVRAVKSTIESDEILPGAQFADAFSLVVDDVRLDARSAAEKMFSRSPQWVDGLMALRNGIVAPFGLKTSAAGETSTTPVIGMFPVVSQIPDRLVAGFDDRHLDFRLVVDVIGEGNGRRVTATTMVRTHNRLGRIYLAAILPFHRIIVPAMMRQIAEA